MKVITKHKRLLSWTNRERSATYSKNKKSVYRSILTPKRSFKFFSLNSSYTHKKMKLSYKQMLMRLTKRLGLARRFNDRSKSLNLGHLLPISNNVPRAAQGTDTETPPASDIKWRRLVNLKDIVKAFIPNCAVPAVTFGDSTEGMLIQGLLGLFKDVLLKRSLYSRRALVQVVTDSSNRLHRECSPNRQNQQTQNFHNSQAENDNIDEHSASQTENVQTHSASQTENFDYLSTSQLDNSGDSNTTQRDNFDDHNSSQRDTSDDPSAFQMDHSNVQSLQDLNEASSSHDPPNIGTLNSFNFNESGASSAENEIFQSQRETSVSPLLVSLTEPSHETAANSPATTSVLQPGTVSGQSSNASIYDQLGIMTEKPRRPQYALKCQRLGTFESWPQHHFMKPEELATAGLFYTGRVDCVRCFFCGGGLRDWELGDDIWVEHARWFPKCAYLKQHVSQAFVETVQELKSKDRISLEEVISKLKEMAALRKDFNIPEIKNHSTLETQPELANNQEVVNITTHRMHNQQTTGATSDVLMNKLKQEERRSDLVKCGECGSSGNGNESEVISRLQEKNNHLRQQLLCKICMGNDVEVVFLPCGHLVSCAECASAMKDCPVCRKFVRGTVRVYLC
ncbi:death-associated inhibitor of apoptosis 1-like isoform X2 [Biomphalaria pfeifferi]|uniref:Death-associated inhibitor of apoptosis 1-like isoform X2 n=1 Tax=Biomphalaria pfeifferi TaxID=112525 RepID=A0AAD8FHF1_BIOPF|nr:death-associated inhibitor of apoptosis 1-like isoform X2 [Biomphalaria pfeifferi]